MPKSKSVHEIAIIIDRPCWNDTNVQWEEPIRSAVLEALHQARWVQAAEVNILLTDNATVQYLNKTYRGVDKPTNVLAFPSLEPGDFPTKSKNNNNHLPIMLGDIALAYETLVQESALQRKSLQDHLIHLVVHGILHLLGFDHEKDEKAAIMESLEIKILSDLNIRNPYED